MPEDVLLAEKPKRKSYPVHQCVFFKLSSKGKLASILNITSVAELTNLADSQDNYKVFLKDEVICPFVGKTTKARWVQEPKEQLKQVQRRIQKLLGRVGAPSYCHGGLAGHSYRSNAKSHTGGDRCATFDIKSFFPSTSFSKVFLFFKDVLLCEPDVAKILASLCCFNGVLPTGAPTSPILSIYANLGLFDAMANMAVAHGLTYTVYVDDITFSGNSIPRGIVHLVQSLVERNGHSLSVHKTKQFSKGQARHVTGVVVHKGRVQVPHSRFRKARAIENAIAAVEDPVKKLVLTNKLVGLVGEAAYLDARFKPKAQAVYKAAEELRARIAMSSVGVKAA